MRTDFWRTVLGKGFSKKIINFYGPCIVLKITIFAEIADLKNLTL